MPKEDGIQSITRVLGVIEALNRRNISSVDMIHKLTGLPKPTLIRILRTIEREGYIFHVSRLEGYALTEKVLRLSAGFRYHDAIVDVARPLLEAFTKQHKWQVSIATLEGDSMRVRFNTRHLSPFAPETRFLNRRLSMLDSALGRAYLAHCSSIERDLIIKSLISSAPELQDRAGAARDIEEVLERVRINRYAAAERQAGDPVRSFAVPVRSSSASGEALASIAMFYFASVMSEVQATDRFLEGIDQLSQQIALALSQVYEAYGEDALEAPAGPGRQSRPRAGDSDQINLMRELEIENARLRRAVSDLTLDKMALTDAVRGEQ